MKIFITTRLSNGNGLFPTELHIDEKIITIVKPGMISLMEKSIKIDKITSIEVISPLFGFSKIIISAYNLDKIIIEGYQRREAEEIKYLITKYMK